VDIHIGIQAAISMQEHSAIDACGTRISTNGYPSFYGYQSNYPRIYGYPFEYPLISTDIQPMHGLAMDSRSTERRGKQERKRGEKKKKLKVHFYLRKG